MQHVMIDIETLGTKSNSVFLSLAAIQFDLDTGEAGKRFKMNIDLQSAIDVGLTIDASTLNWWLEQRPEILKMMFQNPSDLRTVLQCFYDFIDINCMLYPWGNSARFDLGLIDNAFEKLNLSAPWEFRNERCYRTIVNMFPTLSSIEKPKDAHNPLIDCEYQIAKLCEIYKVLKKSALANSIIF